VAAYWAALKVALTVAPTALKLVVHLVVSKAVTKVDPKDWKGWTMAVLKAVDLVESMAGRSVAE
jgi:hypothetical protein